MNFEYIDNLPTLPQDIVDEILSLIETPIVNFHDSDQICEYLEQQISSDSDLQLNSINQELLTAIQNLDYNETDSLGFPMSSASEHFTGLAKFDFLEVNDKIKEWVFKNITPTPIHISIQCMHSGKTITPHVDEARKSVFNYIISSAGATTCFWKPAKTYSHLKAYPQTIFTYDRLELENMIHIEPNRWHRLDILKIHSVENINPSDRRISLSLSYL